jgi:hypothetical protein
MFLHWYNPHHPPLIAQLLNYHIRSEPLFLSELLA